MKPLDPINFENLAEKIMSIFESSQLEVMAYETGFIQRKTNKIRPRDFLKLMTTELLQEPSMSYESLCESLSELNPQVTISPQGLEQRVNSSGAVNYLKQALGMAMTKALEPVETNISPKLLEHFPRIFIQDSTQFTLHEKLAEKFKGSGGSASSSGGKIDLVYEFKTQRIFQLQVSEGSRSDQSRAKDFLEWVQKQDLVIRDLGYFSLQSIQEFTAHDAYYLSRLLHSVDVYLSADSTEPLNLPKYINEHERGNSVIELAVFIGKKTKIPTRLIIYRLPQEIVNKKRYEARKTAKKKGRTPTKHQLAMLEFNLFITNVPSEIWSASVVGTIYRLRWQIELRFKEWKSLLEINVLKGTRAERIQCWLYGRLICIVMMTLVFSWACWYAALSIGREVSLNKLLKWLTKKNRFSLSVQHHLIPELLAQIAERINQLCKQERKRKTTLKLIDHQIDYMDSFTMDKTSVAPVSTTLA